MEGVLESARRGACSALLKDGRVVITGGTDGSAPTASAEVFDDNGNVSPASPMLSAHSEHVCVALADRRLLVAGGVTVDGSLTNQAEIYDPAADRWTPAGSMLVPRRGATASALKDGTVLIAGGESAGVPTATLELFDPATGQFNNVVSVLSSPRKDHAAAVLKDGRVLIAGGTDGSVSLASVDIYDPYTGTVSSAGQLTTPRAGLSATRLLEGKVFFAGGNDGSQDLASAEVFDPNTSAFTAKGSMGTARRGHLAFLIPDNNSVLLAGGALNGDAVTSAELYVPWQDRFKPTGSLNVSRAQAAGSAVKSGTVMLAGGANKQVAALSSTERYATATLTTDKTDYAPGDMVTITGAGWQPGETVALQIPEDPDLDNDSPIPVINGVPFASTADAHGNFTNSQFAANPFDAATTFTLTATGQASGLTAQTTFTDTSPDDTSMTVPARPIPSQWEMRRCAPPKSIISKTERRTAFLKGP